MMMKEATAGFPVLTFLCVVKWAQQLERPTILHGPTGRAKLLHTMPFSQTHTEWYGMSLL